jgi:hypothetical protein
VVALGEVLDTGPYLLDPTGGFVAEDGRQREGK